MTDLINPPAEAILNAPAGRHNGEIGQAWQQVAFRSLAVQLTRATAACAQAAELISIGTPSSEHADALLEPIAQAEEALDAAHELADEAGNPDEPYCTTCGQLIGVFTDGGPDWQHCQQRPDPVTGLPRREIRDAAHMAAPAWRPRNLPAITSGRIAAPELPAC